MSTCRNVDRHFDLRKSAKAEMRTLLAVLFTQVAAGDNSPSDEITRGAELLGKGLKRWTTDKLTELRDQVLSKTVIKPRRTTMCNAPSIVACLCYIMHIFQTPHGRGALILVLPPFGRRHGSADQRGAQHQHGGGHGLVPFSTCISICSFILASVVLGHSEDAYVTFMDDI